MSGERASWIVVGVALFGVALSACLEGGHVGGGGGPDMAGNDAGGGGGGGGGAGDRGRGGGGTDGATGKAVTSQAPDANDWPGGFPYNAGGGADDDDSGTLSYVRLEYGGAPRIADGTPTEHEMLGLYGVGSKTTISYIDIREGN